MAKLKLMLLQGGHKGSITFTKKMTPSSWRHFLLLLIYYLSTTCEPSLTYDASPPVTSLALASTLASNAAFSACNMALRSSASHVSFDLRAR